MVASKRLPYYTHCLLWVVCVGAVLTGFWLAPSALVVALAKADLRDWVLAGIGSILLVGGALAWSRRPGSGSQRQELVRLAQIGVVTLAALASAWVVAGVIGINYRVCRPGDTSGPSEIAWLAPAVAYYSLGYLGFARSRRLRLLWPSAAVVAVFVLLAVELIWTTGSGCGD